VSVSDIVLVIGGCCFILVGVALILNAGGQADRAAQSGREVRQVWSPLERVILYPLLFVPTTQAGGRRLGIALVVLGALGIAGILAGD
jgi:hypothetical protein